ncbi:MAG: 3-isopropylmalate dehydratase small subunit, partial [Patulibacter sp.]
EDAGFKAIIAVSLADIFYSNSTKIGLLPIELPEDQVRKVAAAGHARISLEDQTVEAGGETFSFEINPETKHRLLNGLDDISLTLEDVDKIDAFEQRQAETSWKPSSTSLPTDEALKTTPVAS